MNNLKSKFFIETHEDLVGIVSVGPIAIVDDSEDFRFLFEHIYKSTEKANLLLAFSNGNELVKYLEKADLGEEAIPDLILMDINLPGLDGFEAIKKIRAKKKFKNSPPIVIFSSSTATSDYEKAKKAGASGFVTKPARVVDYKRMIGSL